MTRAPIAVRSQTMTVELSFFGSGRIVTPADPLAPDATPTRDAPGDSLLRPTWAFRAQAEHFLAHLPLIAESIIPAVERCADRMKRRAGPHARLSPSLNWPHTRLDAVRGCVKAECSAASAPDRRMPTPPDSISATPTESDRLSSVRDCLREASVEPLSDRRFLESHDCFEAVSTQRAQIKAWFAHRSFGRPPQSVVSIGSGGGDLDLSILQSLRDEHRTRRYTGVNPNAVECERCSTLMRSLEPDVETLVLNASFDTAALPAAAYDLVYAVQTLYYLGDVEKALARAIGLLRPGGELVVFQAPRGKLNRLSALSWELLLQRRIDFSEDLLPLLEPYDAEVSRIDAWVDVSPCLASRPSDQAVALRDFILQVNSQRLGSTCVAVIDAYLKSISRQDEEGRWWAPHPVDAHSIRQRDGSPS